jgi:hypothetical protein
MMQPFLQETRIYNMNIYKLLVFLEERILDERTDQSGRNTAFSHPAA